MECVQPSFSNDENHCLELFTYTAQWSVCSLHSAHAHMERILIWSHFVTRSNLAKQPPKFGKRSTLRWYEGVMVGLNICQQRKRRFGFLDVCFHQTRHHDLKGRWPWFQARAPPLSFLAIEGRAAENPPPSVNMHIYYVISLASVVKPLTVKLLTVKTTQWSFSP